MIKYINYKSMGTTTNHERSQDIGQQVKPNKYVLNLDFRMDLSSY